MTENSLPILTSDQAPSADIEQGLFPGRWWHRDGEKIVCDLCPRACALAENDRGFCFVRQNVGGKMALTTYGRSTGFCVDPIEKKPLNHFYPGSSVLSFGTAGCNLGCKFCQNWDISKSREIERLSARALPDEIAEVAAELGCQSVAFTYNDPIIWSEYAIETSKACHARGVKTVAVTAGYITESARADFFEHIDAANVDLKAFTEEFYYRVTLSHLQPVLDTLRWLKQETDVWFEITNLVIPQMNDDSSEFQQMCDWILNNVGDEVPLHFSAFHPDFRMLDRGATPPETLIHAREIALQAGLKYVYTGNVNDAARQSTYCPGCQQTLIERNWYQLGKYALNQNQCRYCGTHIAGHFNHEPGTWGQKRLPVDIQTILKQSKSHSPQADPQKGSSPMQADQTPRDIELTSEHEQKLLQKAAAVVVGTATRTQPEELTLGELEDLVVNGAFVSLKRQGQLRSCCGNFGQPLPLGQALHQAAVRAAKDDPRFPPISSSELAHLDLEVWLLSDLEVVEEQGADRLNAVTVGLHGLQIRADGRSGLLLPGVPLDHGWNAEEFLNQTCIKAGLPPTAWKDPGTTLLRYQGISCSARLADMTQTPVESSSRQILGQREFAQYLQYVQSTIEALMNGQVPQYYCPHVSDANIQGLALILTKLESGEELALSKWTLKQSFPMQSTVFSLCQQLVQNIARLDLRPGEFQVKLVLASDPAMHGTVERVDLTNFDTQNRSLLLIEGQKTGWLFDREREATHLIEQAQQAVGITQPESVQVLSLAVQTSVTQFQIVNRPRAELGPAIRPAGVAGTFYPADPGTLEGQLDDLFYEAGKPERWAAAMLPHAGWMYSGKIAADVLKRIELPSTIIVIGPKHTREGVDWAVAPHRVWQLPNGELESNVDLAKTLSEQIPGLERDAAAHRREHAIEVELPLIKRLAPQAQIVGIAIGGGNLKRCEQFAEGLARVIQDLDEPPLLLISSDMNHFATDAENRRLDQLALEKMLSLDPEGLLETVQEHHISMCGVLPAVIVMKTLQKMGKLSRVEQVGYTTSGDITGDRSRVVGYAGLLLN
ncbi:MAG: AmmeMemoRadiSam system radical SAM enzyme [Planctomycetaceae bacterium]|nr:AmmeMemoRadiSam system radical SAM enzyme [Planctomycetaceae bacterium]